MDGQMEGLICLDASVLIEYFRKKKKRETLFAKLSLTYPGFVVPAIAHFEIYNGSTPLQNEFWNNLFLDFLILPFTASTSLVAIEITKQLKASRTTIEFKDLTIAASALHNNLPLATINERHFKNINGLYIITPSSFNS
jgi:predicted nucleic acid-binding protein